MIPGLNLRAGGAHAPEFTAKTEADAIRSSIKTEMEERGVEKLQAGSYIIRWTSVLSNRFDSAAFKRVHDDLYKAFTKQVASRRFSISA